MSNGMSPDQEREVINSIHKMLGDIDKFSGPIEVLIPLVDYLIVTKAWFPASTAPMVKRAVLALLGNLYAVHAAIDMAKSQMDIARQMPDYQEFLQFLKDEMQLDLEHALGSVFQKGEAVIADIARFEAFKAEHYPEEPKV